METYLTSIGIEQLEKLNGFHNEIYKGTYNQKGLIIRISNRRSEEELLEEMTILNNLKNHVNIASPIKVNDQFVITYNDQVICFFELVDGQNWYETTLTLDTHFEAGKELGLLHKHMQDLPKTSRKSFKKHPDIVLLEDAKDLYKSELQKVLSKLDTEHAKENEYGLIHGDYLFSNLLYHNPKVTIIDFDDMEYNYYLYDVAVYLFYLLLGGDPSNMDIEPNIEVFKSFIKGYRSVNQSTVLDFSKIQDLFRLRQLKLLATITTKFDPSKYGAWQKNFIALCEEQFENNADFIDIAYEEIAKEIL